MAETKYTDNVVIEGSRDLTQLRVEGTAGQTKPLQQWQDDADSVKAQVTHDGRLQIGNDWEDSAPTALIEVHRDDTPGDEPTQGLSVLATLSGAASRVLEWVVHKLQLHGSGGVSSQATALRAELTHNNTGDSSAADLRGGSFEVVNQSGSSATPVGQAVGVRAAVSNLVNANLSTGIGLQIAVQDEGTLTHAYGLKIEDVQDATHNYAIQTGQGDVEFGGDVEVKGQLTAPTFTVTAAGLVPSPGTTSGRYLKDDGTWSTIASSASSPWTKTGNDLYYSSGNVGVGEAPDSAYKLDVMGTARIGGRLTLQPESQSVEGGHLTLIGAGSNPAWHVDVNGPNLRLFNTASGTRQVEIFSDPSMNPGAEAGLYVQGKIGIGTKNPATKFEYLEANTHIQMHPTQSTVVVGSNNGGSIYFGSGSITAGRTEPTAAIETSWGDALNPQIGIGVIRDGLKANILMDHARNIYLRDGSNVRMHINPAGDVGIGKVLLASAAKLDVQGNVRADNYIEYSDMFIGDALTAVKSIRPEASDDPTDLSTGTGWVTVDHNTLPEGVKITLMEEHYVNKRTGEQLEADKVPDQTENPEDWEKRSEETLGRSVGAGVQLNLRAIQQLIEQVEHLTEQNGQLLKRITQLEASAS